MKILKSLAIVVLILVLLPVGMFGYFYLSNAHTLGTVFRPGARGDMDVAVRWEGWEGSS